jgi:PAS domain-containing protein
MSTHKRTKSGSQPGAGEKGINLSNEKPAKQEKSEVIDEFLAIMDGVEGRVYVADMQTYKILRVNKYTEKHYGKNLVGKKCYEVFQEGQERPCSFCTNDRLIVEGRPGPPVVWDFQDAKTRLWYHCIDRAIRWPDGRFVRMEIAIDITERKKAEIALCRSGNFLDTIFDSINDPFNIIDRDFRIIRANDS